MPEEFDKLEPEPDEPAPQGRRRFFSVRNAGILAVVLAFIGLAFVVSIYIAYRGGVVDTYVEDQFTTKMADIGIVFSADEFDVTVSPFELHLVNATFNNKTTGEKLFFIRDARLGLSVVDVFSWSLSRDISINTTDINGAEVWITFDENGRSNYSDLVFVEEEGARVNFRYDSIVFSLKEGVVHYGLATHSISGDANNVVVNIEPEPEPASPELASAAESLQSVPSEELRFVINASATDSVFVWDGSPLNEIDIRAHGVAYGNGADVHELRIDSPIGTMAMNGKITNWADLTYELNVESTVDLTQTSNTFPMETTLRGVANFRGKILGQGATYHIEGTADSQALSADNVYLKAVNIEGTVAGTNANYEANGTAVAELLTYGDFRVEFPRMVGNIRGTGTDFRWVGELQAAAVKAGSMTIGNLFLSDATAELNDQKVDLAARSGRAQKFSVGDTEFQELIVRNLGFANQNGVTTVTGSSANAQSMKLGENSFSGMTGGDLLVKTGNGQTDVNIKNLTAKSSKIAGADLRDLRSSSFALKDRAAETDITLNNVTAAEVDAGGTRVSGVESPAIQLVDNGVDTKIYADQLRVAKIVSGGAELGSLNIGGVRLAIKEGYVEGTSNDIDAGTITLLKTETLPNGGRLDSVKVVKPVFVVEDSGRYRASFDMSIGGGIVGTVPLGDVRANVDINNDRVQLNDLNGEMMNGTVNGNATIAFNTATTSKVAVDFANLDIETLLSLQSGAIPPLVGKTTGRLDVTFQGTDLKTTSGTVKAGITADAGSAAQGSIPVTGDVAVTATNGLFTVDVAKFNTPKSALSATGQFDVRALNSDLHLVLNSTDAMEIERIFRSMDIAPDAIHFLDSINASFAGTLAFTGDLTGNTSDPVLDGRAAFETFALNSKPIGSVTTAINVSPFGVRLSDGILNEIGGGNATFDIVAPSGGANNTTVQAKLTNINAGDLIAALPVRFLDRFGKIEGRTSGSVDLSGLPDRADGSIDLTTANGTIGAQSFQNLIVKADFDGSGNLAVNIGMTSGGGTFRVDGTVNTNTTAFNVTFSSNDMPLATVVAVLPPFGGVSSVSGVVDATGTATGEYDNVSSYAINFSGAATDVVINDQTFGTVTFNGNTNNQVLNAEMVVMLAGKAQPITATLNFGDPNLPFAVRSEFNESPLGPFFALVPQTKDINISGVGTGTIRFGGNLSHVDQSGVRVYSTENLIGEAHFASLALRIEETPLVATEPVVIRFNPQQMTFDSAKFAGGGSNVSVAGTVALSTGGVNDLSVVGRVNLALLNVIGPVKSADAFFAGFADVAMRLTGTYEDSQLSGSTNLENASVATFVGSERLTFERLNGRLIFTSKQAQIESLTGYLGGGEFTATGGVLFTDDLQIDAYRVSLIGNDVTIPYPDDFITTGDANLEITGKRIGDELTTLITGNIRASRVVYSKDIDLATVISGRGDGSLSTGSSSISAPTLDLTIEGRDALVVQNNIADLTASLALRVTGKADDPQVTGRIVANSGQILFRRNRYDIQRLVVEFPPGTDFEPVISLQAETEIAGYQIFVNLSGPLTDTEQLNASVRSSPALPQADVISLITTGSLANTSSGIPTLAQTGINTAAEVITDSIINEPVRKATDRLFGLNVFEIDPIITGSTSGPGARLTVGRQINNNLRVTYSTNLSQDQNQVLAFEYRVSNTFSFVATYEQRSLTNVTHSRNNFSFGVRFRRRF